MYIISEDYRTECRKILDLGIYFSKQKDCWKWLTRQLLAVATNTGKNCKDDGGRMEAVCRYVSGRHYMAPGKYWCIILKCLLKEQKILVVTLRNAAVYILCSSKQQLSLHPPKCNILMVVTDEKTL